MQSCTWPGDDPLMVQYHDEEWGTPNHDDAKLFEFIVLDSMQAGLSWRIILHKRESMRRALAGFDPVAIAQFSEADVERLMQDAGIIRNRQKLQATITNAQIFLDLQRQHGTFAKYLWSFVGGEPIINHFERNEDIPATSPESDAMSAALKAAGMKFVGSTICYAFMQGAGLINDHLTSCFRHAQLSGLPKAPSGR